ncbi:hypothetical protein NLJ89_g7439 [Agrocybe chaxingu]|uniref:Uncharacterized protein n=1 Tax=Agrocybe chaxingu TaxID=84603 RepID=A0A9W8JX74_9AGAR|nr:hypothetical protein NLJ89_g7439 [Agrocybe chaxingu]
MSTSNDIPENPTFNGADTLLKSHMLGTIFAGVAYGIIIVKSLDCFRMVWKNKTRIRTFTLIYIVVMTAVSTVSFVLGIVVTMNSIFRLNIRRFDILGLDVLLFPLALWGADGFMMYRCIMLYQGVPRVWRITLYTLFGFLSCLLLGVGVMLPVTNFGTPFLFIDIAANPILITLLLVSLTSFVNLTLTTLVTVRLYYHQRNTRKILGAEYGSPYSRTIAICVESSALIVVVDLAFVICLLLSPDMIPLLEQLLVHASVLSPFLIISRVARRTDVLSTMKPQQNTRKRRPQLEEGGRLDTLRFNHASEGQLHSTEYSLPNGSQLRVIN